MLQSHPHDSISGTGVDQVENDVNNRLTQCRNISNGIINRSLQAIQININNSDLAANEIALTVFNPSPFARTEIKSLVIDLPYSAGYKNYEILDGITHKIIEFQEESRYEHPAIVRHLGDATMEMPSLRVHLHLTLRNIPAIGYKTLILKPLDDSTKDNKPNNHTEHKMENDYLSVTINQNGTLNITDKLTGQKYSQIHYFADNGEVGHAWRHVPPLNDRIIDTLDSIPEIELLQSGPLLTRYAVTHSLEIPQKKDEGKSNYITRLDADGDDAGRSIETDKLVIRSEFTLTKESRGVAVKTTFSNKCEDHRLRVMFPTNLSADYSCAEEPFDVVERPIERDEDSPWANTWNPTHPHQRFVDVSDGTKGLAIINDGLREYEVTDDKSRTIALTLLRAFELSLTTVAWKWERHPEMKGSQSPGDHEFNYFIYPHAGDWDNGSVLREAELFNVPIDVAQAGPHSGTLPKELSFINLIGEGLVISALKRSEETNNIVIRIYNPTKRQISGELHSFKKISEARYLNLNEEPLNNDPPKIAENNIIFDVNPKKIVTIGLLIS